MSIGVVKCGLIGSSALLEYALDERADREDIVVFTYSTGSKMLEDLCERVAKLALEGNHDLYIVASPNASLPGPTRIREILKTGGKPVIVISDGAAKSVVKKLEEQGFGYIIVLGDSMIGARREFLDPTEMVLYNSDVLRVLAVCGVYRLIQSEIDRVIREIKEGKQPTLPRVVVDRHVIVQYSTFKNPYALAKAIAAYETARNVADLTYEACFKIKEWERYTVLVAAAHEMMRTAAQTADQAREIEKCGDHVVRQPHSRDGATLYKEKLIEKPQRA